MSFMGDSLYYPNIMKQIQTKTCMWLLCKKKILSLHLHLYNVMQLRAKMNTIKMQVECISIALQISFWGGDWFIQHCKDLCFHNQLLLLNKWVLINLFMVAWGSMFSNMKGSLICWSCVKTSSSTCRTDLSTPFSSTEDKYAIMYFPKAASWRKSNT